MLDLMLIVLAIAPGFALSRIVYEEIPVLTDPSRLFGSIWGKAGVAIGVMTPVLLTLTPGFLLLRLLPPRRPGKRLWRSWGAFNLAILSCVGPIAGLGIWAVLLVSENTRGHSERMAISILLLPIAMASAAGAALLGFRLLGIRARSPDWLDRLGIIWGVLWFIVAPIDLWTLVK